MKAEKKNKLLAVSLAVLSMLSALIAWIRAEPSSDVDKTLFRVENPESVSRVLLVSDDTVDLAFGPGGWTVNKAHKADVNMIKVLMATLLQHEPRRPVSRLSNDSIASRLEREGTRVSVFSGDEMVQEFFVGGN
ncbi:MAG TPA: hypothetical protein VEB86_15625, partial [Chryseosolibacter sp.]|nr:hypothetical protein [Chryseosolibacter sp.]